MDAGKKIEWNKETTIKLIELWEEHSCLYDSKNRLYSNKHARHNALADMVDGLKSSMPGVSQDDIKIKINTLRSQYNHELQKQQKSMKSGAGADDIYNPGAYWFEKLSFLKKHIKPRKGTDNLETTSNYSSGSELQEVFLSTSSLDYVDDIAVFSPTTIDLIETPPSTSGMQPQTTKRKKVDEDIVLVQASDAICSIASALKPAKPLAQKYPDDIETFGEYLKSELNSIRSEDDRDDVKQDIINILYKYKKKQRQF